MTTREADPTPISVILDLRVTRLLNRTEDLMGAMDPRNVRFKASSLNSTTNLILEIVDRIGTEKVPSEITADLNTKKQRLLDDLFIIQNMPSSSGSQLKELLEQRKLTYGSALLFADAVMALIPYADHTP